MSLRGVGIALFLLCSSSIALYPQGYETKFKATGFKPGDVYHTDEGVNVSLTGGGLEVEIPLGPALPGPIPIRPVVHYHGKYSQTLNPSWAYGQAFRDGLIMPGSTPGQQDTYEKAYKRWLPPNLPFGEIHPGHLSFRAGSTALGSSAPDLTLTSPFGKTTSYYLGMPGAYSYDSSKSADVSDIDDLAKTMAPEWDRSTGPLSIPECGVLPGTPVSRSLGTSIGVRLSGGSTLIFGPSDAQIFRRWTASYNPILSELLLVPREILQVDKDFITLWRKNRNVYSHDWDPKDVNGTLADYRWTQSIYHPVWIKTRSGFRADVTIYRNAPAGHNACLSDGGILTGYRVSINNGETWFQVGYAPGVTSGPTLRFGGMDAVSTDGGEFSGFTPPRTHGADGGPLDDFQPGTTIGYDSIYSNPFYWELEYTSATLAFGASSITYGDLTTSFEWDGPQGQLSKLTTPSGKTYTFTHQLFQGVGTDSRAAGNGVSWLWSVTTPQSLDYYSMVTRMDIEENRVGSPQTRSTTYRWKLPGVDPLSPIGTMRWTSPAQGVAQTLPSGETILHVFCSPMNSDSSSTRLEPEARTFLAARQAVSARYHYLRGDRSWESFLDHGADPFTTTWYARERYEGWDLRSWEDRIREPRGANPIYLSTNTEPRPTRTLKEERDGPVEVTELDAWNADLGNYAVKRTYVMAAGTFPLPQFWAPGAMQGLNAPLSPGEASYVRHPGLTEPSPTSALAHQVTLTTYSSDKTAGLLDRDQKIETKVILAPPTGATGFVARTQNILESGTRAHIISQLDQLDLQGGTNALSLSFVQQPLGLFNVNQLQGVTLSSNVADANLSGLVGATYQYETTGRFMTSIQQLGVNWSEQEPDHDNMGRPLSHKDPNDFTTNYNWDVLGRLTAIVPPKLETATSIRPENTLRKTTLTREGQTLVYHYNGFSELIGEERTGPSSQVSHRVHGYDTAGRKTYETTWRRGPLTDFTEWATPKVGGNGVTAWAYDGRGRVIKVVNANGEVTETNYITPLRTERKIHPDIAGIGTTATTTFENDVLGRLAKVTDAASQITSYAYDAAGRIRQVQQGGQTRSWTYDLFGRLETLTQPEAGVTKYEDLTVTNKPTRTIYGYGSTTPKVVTTRYDTLSRPLSITSSDGTVDQAFIYDGESAGGRQVFGNALSQLSYSRDRSIELWYTYGGLNGRLDHLDTRVGDATSPSDPGQYFSQVFDYAKDGLRQSASVDGRIHRLSLDPASRLPVGVTHVRSDGYTLMVANFSQDGVLWAPTRIDYGNGAFTELGYRPDQAGLARLSHSLPAATTSRISWSYEYDGAGWLKGDGQDSYDYDSLGRLRLARVKSLASAQVLTQKLTYDAVGNMLSSVTTPDAGPLPNNLTNFTFPASSSELARHNQLPAAQTGAQYDPQGNLTSVWKTVSASGPFIKLAYDALGRVLAMYDSASGLKESYAYTPEGLRTRIDTYNGAIRLKTRYKIYNDQRQLVSEYEMVQAEAPGPAPAQTSKIKSVTLETPKLRSKTSRQAPVARKHALLLAEEKRDDHSKKSRNVPVIRYRNNDGTFPEYAPSLIDNSGPVGSYITYPIGGVTLSQGFPTSFTGATDFGTDYIWDFGDGTPTVSGSFEVGNRSTPTISHTFNTLSAPSFLVTFTVRNTAGGYTQSTATLTVTVVPPALPVINAFTANGLKDTATAYWGDAAVLTWDVAGATSVSIDQGVGSVDSALNRSVEVTNLQATTTYTLTATNATGSVTQGVRIRVLPKVQSFSADANPIDAGTGTMLIWNVAGATAISLQEGVDGPWDVTGTTSRAASPLAPMGYALTASNDDGASPASSLQLNVIPVISGFSASPAAISSGQTSTLSWATVGMDLVQALAPDIGPVTGTSQVVSPTATTAYTLTVANSYISVSRSVEVTLNAPPIILSQPANQSVAVGQSAIFQVGASGQGPLTYQWMKNGTAISGARNSSYATPATLMTDDGSTFSVMVTNAYGSVLSLSATLTVAPDLEAPRVTASETGTSGNITFAATGSDNVGVTRVEFYVDDALKGSTASSPYCLTLDSSTLTDASHILIAKAYDLAGNMGTSPPVAFTIRNAVETAPSIAVQPFDQVVTVGQMATFTVTANGSGPPTYQWHLLLPGYARPVDLDGATGPSYTTPATTLADNGATYTVTITNNYGSVTSVPATLTVNPASMVGVLVWKRDIVYAGTKEVGEVDADGLHITQVDHLGSPRLLSDKNGNLEDEQKYMPFGQYLDGQQKSRKGFTGHEQTDSSRLIYMQARFYAPWYGRFLSPDPARDQHFEETQSWNIYSYVQNNPTMLIDPNGMAPQDPNYQISLGSRRPDLLIVHDTAGQLSRKGFDGMKARRELSGHLYVDRGGEIWENRPLSRNASATKAEWSTASADKRLDSNMTVNVELNNPIKDPSITDKQYGTLAQIAVGILGGIDGNLTISPHREIDRGIPNGHEDPRGFDPAKFEAALREACKKAGIDFSRVKMAPKEAWSRRNTAGAKRQTPPEKKKEDEKK